MKPLADTNWQQHPSWIAIRRELEFGPTPVAELALVSGLSKSMVRRWLGHARRHGIARRCGYETCTGALRAVWELGNAADAKPPRADRARWMREVYRARPEVRLREARKKREQRAQAHA